MAIHVGTSGWAYPEWQPGFYPVGLPRARFLEHYGQTLTACEINATFYRLQSESAVTTWAEAVPESFRFAVKVHRRLTHSVTLMSTDEDRDFARRFVESIAPLGPRLGVLLAQFPASRQVDIEGLARLLDALGPGRPVACELRHASWEADGVDEAIAAAGATRCLADVEGPPPPALPPGPHAYVRLRADRYDDVQRDGWRALLGAEAAGREVFVFAKHKGVPAGDPHVGVGLAEWLVGARA